MTLNLGRVSLQASLSGLQLLTYYMHFSLGINTIGSSFVSYHKHFPNIPIPIYTFFTTISGNVVWVLRPTYPLSFR